MNNLSSTSEVPFDFTNLGYFIEDDAFADLLSALPVTQNTSIIPNDQEPLEPRLHNPGDNDLIASPPAGPLVTASATKIGARFSKDVLRTLRSWLAVHKHRPYPNEEEIAMLMEHTSLNKTQILNWFANARRRGYMRTLQQTQATPSHPLGSTRRPGTPVPRSDTNSKKPLERWVDSPPEDEPATVDDIARAVASHSHEITRQSNSLYGSRFQSIEILTPDVEKSGSHDSNNMFTGPQRSSGDISSASSVGTSRSSDVLGYSSSESHNSTNLSREARRRRVRKNRRAKTQTRTTEVLPFQCTFCTDTFKNKHDWQRHEKSLHLPLERWICSIHSHCITDFVYAVPQLTEVRCLFCNTAAPDDIHIEGHNYSACLQRTVEQRTYYRKDHLAQHLRLVHKTGLTDTMAQRWRIPMPHIRSRCGFCGTITTTWADRVEHLAEHFKMGWSMANWQGDWGFDDEVLRLVENAVPPYMNNFERSTPFPTRASNFVLTPLGLPTNAYELLKVEIVYFIQNHVNSIDNLPSDNMVQLEACRLILATEASYEQDFFLRQRLDDSSWLRDMLMSSSEIVAQAKIEPLQLRSESRLSLLKVRGKEKLFEQCPLEGQLRMSVAARRANRIDIQDENIQDWACNIVQSMEQNSTTPSELFASWTMKLIRSSTLWLDMFKKRAGLHSTDIALEFADPMISTSDSAMEFASLGIRPTKFLDNTLNASWMTHSLPMRCEASSSIDTAFNGYFVGDLARWVASTISPTNPVSHIPSDEEIQHQARWIMYNDGDPWNQTPADVSEWLWRFKRDVGILEVSRAA